MKIFGLCFLFFVCLAPISQAQQSPNPPKLNPPKNDQVFNQNSQPADPLPLFKKWRTADQPFLLKLDPESAPPGAVAAFCAYMRTYRVKREYRGSDEVSPAGYTTCLPSNRFEVRSAVQVQTEPAPRQ